MVLLRRPLQHTASFAYGLRFSSRPLTRSSILAPSSRTILEPTCIQNFTALRSNQRKYLAHLATKPVNGKIEILEGEVRVLKDTLAEYRVSDLMRVFDSFQRIYTGQEHKGRLAEKVPSYPLLEVKSYIDPFSDGHHLKFCEKEYMFTFKLLFGMSPSEARNRLRIDSDAEEILNCRGTLTRSLPGWYHFYYAFDTWRDGQPGEKVEVEKCNDYLGCPYYDYQYDSVMEGEWEPPSKADEAIDYIPEDFSFKDQKAYVARIL